MIAVSRSRAAPVVVLIGALATLSTLCGCGSRADEQAERITRQPWLVTVYYTAVESFHVDPPAAVTGCRTQRCRHGSDPLGSYPRDFLAAVREEGTGRITTGEQAGRYLNWSDNIGFWLDDAPRDAHGRALEPFQSAAADGIPDGTRLRLVTCGHLDSGEAVPDEVCQVLRTADWEIRDEFTPGRGGANHIDLYIGEESRSDYTASPLYVTLENAEFGLRA